MRLRGPLLWLLLLAVARAAGAIVPNGYYVKDTASDTFYDIAAQRRTIVHDGVFTAADGWDFGSAYARKIYKFDRRDAYIATALAYDAANLYVAVEIQDDNVLEEPPGPAHWETHRGDAIEIYIDPNLSRDAVMQGVPGCSTLALQTAFNCDYVLAFTPSKLFYRFDTGTGGSTNQGSGVDDNTVLSWIKTSIDGTLNDPTPDRFWRAEVAIPWNRLGFASAPAHGSMIGVNVLVRERDDLVTCLGCADLSAWNVPFEPHRFFNFSGDGVFGPANYMRAYLVDPAEPNPPGAITDLAVPGAAGPWSGVVTFTAPGDDPNSGYCEHYAIRTSTNGSIGDDNAWNAATDYPNAFRPRKIGQPEVLELLGLAPGKSNFVSVRCVDHAGHLGPPSNPIAIVTQPAPADPHERGFARVSPQGRYLVWQSGAPIAGVGEHMTVSYRYFDTAWNYGIYNPNDPNGVTNWRTCSFDPNVCGLNALRAHMSALRANGVRVMRLFLEDIGIPNVPDPLLANGLPFLEEPASTTGAYFHPAAQDFLDQILQICRENDMYVILVPFDTYWYASRQGRRDYFPFANIDNSGVVGSNVDAFFTDPTARQAAKKRLEVIADWTLSYGVKVRDHPNILYVDLLNEWDGEWSSLAPTAPERMAYMQDVLAYARTVFPNHLLAASTNDWQLAQAKSDFLLNGASFDLLDIHTYTKAIRDPKATGSGDTEYTARGSLEANQMVRYYAGNAVSPRPVFVSEWGDIETYQSAYDAQWTSDVDTEQFRNISWTTLATGAANAGLRIPGPALASNGPQINDGMRAVLHALRRFIDRSGLDFRNHDQSNWDHLLSFTAPNQTVWAFGSFAVPNGMIYLMQDRRVAGGTVAGGVLTIRGLDAVEGQQLPVTFWDPANGQAPPTSRLASVSGGALQVVVPSFQGGLAVSVPEPLASLAGVAALAALLRMRALRAGGRSA